MLSLEDLFCRVDDFCRAFEPQWQQQLLADGLQPRRRRLHLSAHHDERELRSTNGATATSKRSTRSMSVCTGGTLFQDWLAIIGLPLWMPRCYCRCVSTYAVVSGIVVASALSIPQVLRSAIIAASTVTRCLLD